MTEYLDRKFDWSDAALVSAADELSLWSAMAGLLLLEHVPLAPGLRVLDVGCGTGFPLLELAERLGASSIVIGLDPWDAALDRARQKAKARRITNVQIVKGDAVAMPWPAAQFDLIVSNLGINNFDDRAGALRECFRVTKPGGHIALSTNLVGHMREFFEVFRATLIELGLSAILGRLDEHIAHRATIEQVNALLGAAGFVPGRSFTRAMPMRFADGSALLRHSFIGGGFVDAWRRVVKGHDERVVFAKLEANLNHAARAHGELRMTIPLAYIEAGKSR